MRRSQGCTLRTALHGIKGSSGQSSSGVAGAADTSSFDLRGLAATTIARARQESLPVSSRRARGDSARHEDEDRELAITAVMALFELPRPRHANTDLCFSNKYAVTRQTYLQSITPSAEAANMPKAVGHQVTGHSSDRNSMMSPSNSVQPNGTWHHETRPRQRRSCDAGIGRPSWHGHVWSPSGGEDRHDGHYHHHQVLRARRIPRMAWSR